MAEPPPFQEAARCDICKCSFSTFRRRHHCRCCGRTLCNEHSSNQMALPQFGIHSNVRVCYDCFNNSLSSEKHDPQTPQNINAAAESLSKLDMTEGIVIKPAESGIGKSGSDVPECKCGMPLCICVAPVSDPAPVQVHAAATSVVQPNLRPKKAIATQPTTDSVSKSSGSSNSKQSPSLFFSLGQATNGSLDKPCANYEVNGEGLREAIKSNDATAVKKLLSEGVDANYSDRQGLSLLHLAALFNHTEIVFILMDHGASVSCKNAQGETPLDCAPTTLQYKMRRKMEGV